MRTPDLYTKVVLTIIAICLGILCLEQSHWNRLETVRADSGQVYIAGYVFDSGGSTKTVRLGSFNDDRPGIPVVVVNK
jgi:hypothetical protein